jgi:spore maturation protein CgeB
LAKPSLHFLIDAPKDQIVRSITKIRMKRSFERIHVLTHGPSIRRDPEFYQPLLEELHLMESSPFGSKTAYPRLNRERLTVLVLDSSYFLITECVKALTSLGHKVVRVSVSGARIVEDILRHVAQERPDFLVSVNHLGFDQDGKLTELLEDLKLPFAIWYVDSPSFIVQNFTKNVSPYCVLFVWDRSYLEPMKRCGFAKAHFLPLGTDPTVFKPIGGVAIPALYRNRVSFVGNSMTEAVEDWFGRFPHDTVTKAVVHPAVSLQIDNHRLTMEDILTHVCETQGLRLRFEDPAHFQHLQAALVWKATQEYRKRLVQSLACFGICIFGDAGWHRILDGRIKILPPVSYYQELPLVFNGTEINMNSTSFQMNTAVNQRVFDVAACGAFLVTDRQPDMGELFEVEREAVCYEEAAQARDQVAYYLKHERDRRQIATKARKRVLGEHTYEHRLRHMIKIMREEFGSS